MLRIEAKSLEEAFEQASRELECSITDLKYEVVQNPKKGFLGFGKKSAIIVADKISKEELPQERVPTPQKYEKKHKNSFKDERAQHKEPTLLQPEPIATKEERVQESPESQPKKSKREHKHEQRHEIFDNFYKDKLSLDDIKIEVKQGIDRLFENACFNLNPVVVEPYDENTLFIEFSGEDAALLIGKEGYRYKALSYMLFNWVNTKYGLMIRLEIAEFLKNQEEMIKNYLVPIIEQIERDGRGQTKTLDGVLAHIALKQLRDTFPNKYVSFRLGSDGERYVIVNEFLKKS